MLSVQRLDESQNPPNWVSQNPLAHWLFAEHEAQAAAPTLPLDEVLVPVVLEIVVPPEDDDELLAHWQEPELTLQANGAHAGSAEH